VTELADRVRLTPAPCHRRLRELECNGVITGYRAVLNPAAVGLGFEALVSVTLDRGDADTVAAFEAALAAIPQIRHAERLFGDPDYLLRAVAIDLNDYAALRGQKLATLPGVQRITSMMVMNASSTTGRSHCREPAATRCATRPPPQTDSPHAHQAGAPGLPRRTSPAPPGSHHRLCADKRGSARRE
jgi:DNA-binding Lrp family transcriptional regulator